ncbi:MAG: FtsQ-type POTRA domain-containing protein [Chloroflexota bacterium]
MSPANKPASSRSETVRKRRAAESAKRQYRKTSRAAVLVRNLHPDMVARPATKRSMTKPRKRQYQVALGAKGSRLSIPALPIVEMGWRWTSLALTAAMAFVLYMMWNSNNFYIPQADVLGNQRISAEEINRTLNLTGLSIFWAEPAVIENTLRESYPDLESVSVSVNLPNYVTVVVAERQPVIAWQQGGETLWIDAQGFAFPVRGPAEGLIPVVANGSPPQVQGEVSVDGLTAALPYLSTEMIHTLRLLAPYVPQDTSIFYDPGYGFGWNDSRGWIVYFGKTTADMNLKLTVYQGLSDYLARSGIPATMVSVEFPHHPFYRTD